MLAAAGAIDIRPTLDLALDALAPDPKSLCGQSAAEGPP